MKTTPTPMTTPIETEGDVLRLIDGLVGEATRRQIWLAFLDDADCALPLLMPIDQYPKDRPAEYVDGIAELVATVMREISATSVIITWERPGDIASTASERSWAWEMRLALEARELSLRAQLIAHDEGVRLFPPEEFFDWAG